MSCTHNCSQGRQCTCYKVHFDEFGQERNPPPWTVPDMLMVAFFILTLVGLMTGIFQ